MTSPGMSGGHGLRWGGFAGQQLRVGHLRLALEELRRGAVPNEHEDHAEQEAADADHERHAESANPAALTVARPAEIDRRPDEQVAEAGEAEARQHADVEEVLRGIEQLAPEVDDTG